MSDFGSAVHLLVMFPSSSVAHYSLINLIVLLIITFIVALSLRCAISMELSVRFAGSNRFADDAGHDPGSRAADDYFNRRYFDIKHDLISHCDSDLFHRGRTPSIKKYTKEDVVQCFDFLSSSRQSGNHRPMRFAFVGDSTVRQHFVSFLKVFICTSFRLLVESDWSFLVLRYSRITHMSRSLH